MKKRIEIVKLVKTLSKSFSQKRWLLSLFISIVICNGLSAQNMEELRYFNLVLPDKSKVSYRLTDGIDIHFQDSIIEVNDMNYYMDNIVKYYFSDNLYYTIIVEANPEEGGTVSGGGNFVSEETYTVTAVPNEGYSFWCWVEDGKAVSTETNYSFILSGPRNLVALFRPVSPNPNIIVFADPNVEMVCVENWDTDGDQYLSYDEAAAVMELGNVFRGNDNIVSFGELQYFTGLTSIDNYAFYDCNGLTSLVLPSSLTTIGNSAFYNCSGLTGDLVIPNSVTTIGSYSFYNCSGLTGDLVIPNSVTTISNRAFSGCNGFTGSLTIGDSVTAIGNDAFENCTGFTGDLTIPDSVVTIGSGAFYGCCGFSGCLTIGSSVTSIDYYAFRNCSGFTEICSKNPTPPTLGSSVFSVNTTIPVYVPCGTFEAYQNADYWSNFTNIMGMCGGTVIVEANPIEGGTVTGGGYYESGAQCTTVATANEGFTFVNWTQNGAIVSTSAEYSFYVMGDATLVANFVQDGNIIFADANVKSVCVANWDTNNDGELSYAEAASVTDLSYYFQYNSDITSFDELQYFIGLTSIGDYAFYYCIGLTSIILPNTVTTIGEGAFGECYALTSIVLPNSLMTIGEASFYYCDNVLSITILAITPPSIGEYSFYGLYDKPLIVPCDAIEAYQNADYWSNFTNILGMCGGTITVEANPENGGMVTGEGYYESSAQCTVTAIANEGFTFANWTKNGTIVSTTATYSFYVAGDATLVAHFVQEGNIVFADTNVKSICVANWDANNDGELSYAEAASVTDLSYYFQYNSDITSFDELQYFIGLSSIGDYAFYYCSGLTSFVLPNTVTTIGDGAFGECYALTSVVLPSSLTTIEYNAFYYCTGLTGELVIPETVTTIGDYAFYNCYNLQSIASLAVIPPSIGNYTFYGLYDKSLMVPCDVVETYQNADYWSYFTNIQGLCPGTITIEANPSVGGSVTGEGYYEGGATCTLTAIANTGYTFINWKENGTIVSYDAIYSFIVRGDRDLVANFVEEGSMCNIVFDLYDSYGDGWTNNYLVINYGDGTSEQLTVGSGSAASYSRLVASGSHITLTWISGSYPEDCSFDISFENSIPIYHGSNLSSSFQYEFTVDCAAAFVQYTISAVANPEEGGAIDGAGTYDVGTTCTLTATSNSGYYFLDWTENGEVVSTEPTYSFMVTNNRDLVANFLEGDICAITFDLYDSYGDGYTGNYLVVSYGDVTEQFTVISGYYASHTLYIPNGSHVFLTWVLGSYPEDCSFTISYSNGDIIYQGENLNSTFMFDFYVNCDGLFEITQTITLSEGWNWISTYIDITLDNLKVALVEALGTNASITIKSQTQNCKLTRGVWTGQLTTLDLSRMYNISVDAACEITLEGAPVNPAEHPVTIISGANWIAFPLSESMTITEAFGTFGINGDVIKSQLLNCRNTRGVWTGQLDTLEPGKGYIYNSAATGIRTFTFPANAK